MNLLENTQSPEPPKHAKTKAVQAPFTIVIDSREQLPYEFDNLYTGPTGRSPRLLVPTTRAALKFGDYAVFGFPQGVVERKSKEDLYGSISQRRDNFIGRLETACTEYDFFAVVVEAEWSELLSSPPPHTKFSPKSLARTIQAWMIRYPCVQWIMLPSRAHAEAFTFRLLERYWKDKQEMTNQGSKWSRELIRSWDRELTDEIDDNATATTTLGA